MVRIEFRGALSIYGNSKLVLIDAATGWHVRHRHRLSLARSGASISALTGFMKLWRHRGLPVRLSQPVPDPHRAASSDLWSPVFTSIGGQLLIDGQTVIGAKPILAEIAATPLTRSVIPPVSSPMEW